MYDRRYRVQVVANRTSASRRRFLDATIECALRNLPHMFALYKEAIAFIRIENEQKTYRNQLVHMVENDKYVHSIE